MRSFLLGCVLFLSCLAVCAGQEPGQVQDLAAGNSISVLLTPERRATLRVDLKSSHAEEIVLDAAVPDITYTIAASDGTEILSGRIATFGWVAIPMSAAGRHEVQIRLQTESGATGLPGVRVRAELRPILVTTFEAHRRAAQLFNAAQPLHRSLRGADLRQAIGQFEQAAQVWAGTGDLQSEAMALG